MRANTETSRSSARARAATTMSIRLTPDHWGGGERADLTTPGPAGIAPWVCQQIRITRAIRISPNNESLILFSLPGRTFQSVGALWQQAGVSTEF